MHRFWLLRALIHLCSPGFLLSAGLWGVWDLTASVQSIQSVPHLTLLLLPTLEYASPAFFLWVINSSWLVPQDCFSPFAFAQKALLSTQWQLNPSELLLCPHLLSAPGPLSLLRPCNRRHLWISLCFGWPPPPPFCIPLPGISQISWLLCLKVYCGVL